MNARLRLVVRWLLNAMALMLLPELIDGLSVEHFSSALVTALLLGLINALIRPVLVLVTLPITVLTLGLFTLVINALLFWAVAGLVGGVHVDDFWTAFWSALLYSVLTSLVSFVLADSAAPHVDSGFGRRRG